MDKILAIIRPLDGNKEHIFERTSKIDKSSSNILARNLFLKILLLMIQKCCHVHKTNEKRFLNGIQMICFIPLG